MDPTYELAVARLVLVGMPAVGKSTVARALGERLRCAAIDTDEVVAERVGDGVERFIRERGEAAFRGEELDALRDSLECDAVVATGAGVVTLAEARRLLVRAPTIWLDCPDVELLARVEGGGRPLLDGDVAAGLARLRAQRERWYEECSCARVDATSSVEDVVTEICRVATRANQ